MADLTGMMQAAAGAGGGGLVGGEYLAVAMSNNNLTLLDHSTPGALTLATTYLVAATGGQFACSFNNTGEYIASGYSASPRFSLLDHTTPGTLTLASTVTISETVWAIAFSPDGNYAAVGRNPAAQNFNLVNTSNPGSMSITSSYACGGSSQPVYGVAFSYAGDYVACAHGAGDRFTLLNRSAGSVSFAATYLFANTTKGVAFTSDDDYIAVFQETSAGGPGPGFTLLNHTTPGSLSLATTYTLVSAGVYNSVGGVGISLDDSYIGVTYENGSRFTLLNQPTPGTVALSATYSLGAAGFSVAFTPDGNYIAIGRAGGVTLLDHTTPGSVSLAATYAGGTGYAVSFNPTPPAP